MGMLEKDIHEKNSKIIALGRWGSDQHRDRSVPRAAADPLVHQDSAN